MIDFIHDPEIYPVIFLSSPLRGNYTYNLDKAAEACKRIIKLGGIPVCPHLFYMRCGLMHDRYAEERALGMEHARKVLLTVGQMIVIRKENGEFSEGCRGEIAMAEKYHIPYGVVDWNLQNLKNAYETLTGSCEPY